MKDYRVEIKQSIQELEQLILYFKKVISYYQNLKWYNPIHWPFFIGRKKQLRIEEKSYEILVELQLKWIKMLKSYSDL